MNNMENIDEKDTSIPGYLYCIYNKMYDVYGENVYIRDS